MTDLGDFSSSLGDSADATGESSSEQDNEMRTETDFESYDATPAGQDRGIGVLSAASGLQISEDEDDTRLRAYVTAGNRSAVRIG
jgi:hypothetical protein